MKLSSTLFTFLFLCSSLFAQESVPISKRRMLNDLEYIKNVFEIKYAPANWKKKYAKWELMREYSNAKARICTLGNQSLKEYHYILKDFFNSTKDYHVGVQFFATESAYLPLQIKGAQGRYFVVHIDRPALPFEKYPIQVGDEVLSFNGEPVCDVIERIKREDFGENTPETDTQLAEMTLSYRRACRGQKVPNGEVVLEFCRRASRVVRSITIPWTYTEEFVTDCSRPLSISSFTAFVPNPFESKSNIHQFFNKQLTYRGWTPRSEVGASLVCENKHGLGSKESYLPQLGQEVWRAKKDSPFDAYIFLSPSLHKVGYVRIPHYNGDEEEIKEFLKIIEKFQSETSALVIDQLNNPGGSLFYLYGLLAALTDRELITPHHNISLTQEEVYVAYTLLETLRNVKSDQDARSTLGESLAGYPVSKETVELTLSYCEFLIKEWSKGKLLTDKTYLFGVDVIKPHPKVHYSKPLLLLTSPLNFSGADFFPAIFQDNQLGVILGTRTAGAGGFVGETYFPNQTAIQAFQFTASIAYRKNDQPLENLGVTPDIFYEPTPEDYQTDYAPFKAKILETIESLIGNSTQSPYEIAPI